MSDWHFGMDYDMWLYPPVPFWDPDWDFDLPEPIEAANIEGTLLVNAEDAIEQVRRLQVENERLRELARAFWWCTENPDGPYECHRCPLNQSSETECECEVIMRELGVEP